MRSQRVSPFIQDVFLIGLSVVVALAFVYSGVLSSVLSLSQEIHYIGSFVAGLFFTSVFTTVPAMTTLGEITRIHPLFSVALWGALGAVIGDLIIFRFVRDSFSTHVAELLQHRTLWRRLHTLFKKRLFRVVSFFVGGLIIASPLPDELALGLLGFTKLRMAWFIPLSFAFNFFGIILIGIVARSL